MTEVKLNTKPIKPVRVEWPTAPSAWINTDTVRALVPYVLPEESRLRKLLSFQCRGILQCSLFVTQENNGEKGTSKRAEPRATKNNGLRTIPRDQSKAIR